MKQKDVIALVVTTDKEGGFLDAEPYMALKSAVEAKDLADSYWVVANAVKENGVYIDSRHAEKNTLFFRKHLVKYGKNKTAKRKPSGSAKQVKKHTTKVVKNV